MVGDKKKSSIANNASGSVRGVKTPTSPEVSDLIGRRLRMYYEEVASQPVPDRFLDLLKQLDVAADGKPQK